MDKREIRDIVRQQAGSEKASDSVLIWDRLRSMPQFVSARRVLIYCSLKDEVPTGDFIESIYGTKEIVLPLVKGETLSLKVYDPDKLHSGYCGIVEPDEDARERLPSEMDFAVIPGRAFDRFCNRMGRGRGFYDRLLPEMDCFKVGVAFDYQIFDAIPTDEWDIRLDAVVTPSSIYYYPGQCGKDNEQD